LNTIIQKTIFYQYEDPLWEELPLIQMSSQLLAAQSVCFLYRTPICFFIPHHFILYLILLEQFHLLIIIYCFQELDYSFIFRKILMLHTVKYFFSMVVTLKYFSSNLKHFQSSLNRMVFLVILSFLFQG
jgi:hypothetical protein